MKHFFTIALIFAWALALGLLYNMYETGMNFFALGWPTYMFYSAFVVLPLAYALCLATHYVLKMWRSDNA